MRGVATIFLGVRAQSLAIMILYKLIPFVYAFGLRPKGPTRHELWLWHLSRSSIPEYSTGLSCSFIDRQPCQPAGGIIVSCSDLDLHVEGAGHETSQVVLMKVNMIMKYPEGNKKNSNKYKNNWELKDVVGMVHVVPQTKFVGITYHIHYISLSLLFKSRQYNAPVDVDPHNHRDV